MILRLEPPIPLETKLRGKGDAHFLSDPGQENQTLWGVFIDETGEFWWVPNDEIKLQKNWSLKRR